MGNSATLAGIGKRSRQGHASAFPAMNQRQWRGGCHGNTRQTTNGKQQGGNLLFIRSRREEIVQFPKKQEGTECREWERYEGVLHLLTVLSKITHNVE